MAKEQTGISGEFWFFSQLQRLGYKAYITLGNTKSVDISVELSNSKIITFDVKTKTNFGGSFQYLNIPKRDNHFAVFVNLEIQTNSEGKTTLLNEPSSYIVNSFDIDEIAFHWEARSGSTGYGFEAKLLWFLKFQNMKSITAKNIADFKHRHNIVGEIDFKRYSEKIITLVEFENKYYKLK
jgi:hypothetical protein